MKKYKFFNTPQQVPYIETENRVIKTPIPAPGTYDFIRRIQAVESRSMQGQIPIVWDKAEDFSVYDIAGNKFIDFTSTIFVANIGHSNKSILSYFNSLANKPLLNTYAYINSERVEYIENLISFAGKPFEKAFLMSAGTEATEAALKLMRMHALKINKRRPGIICIEGNWHGRTMGAQSMSSNKEQKQWIGFDDPNIFHIPFPYPWTIKDVDPVVFLESSLDDLFVKNNINPSKDIAGFMLETFQGWGAVFYPKTYVKAIEKFCKKHNLLLTFDEMQAGFSRTGKRFGFQHYDVSPDLICTGKGMGGGVPVSGVLGKAEVMDLPDVGNMSSTHSANPLVAKIANISLNEIIDKNLTEMSRVKGELLHSGLKKIQAKYPKLISYILGKGLIAAMLFKDPKSDAPNTYFPSLLVEKCMQKGLLLVHTGRESIKFGPPLTITNEAIEEALLVIDESITELL